VSGYRDVTAPSDPRHARHSPKLNASTLHGFGRNALWTYGSMAVWTIAGLVVTGYAVRRLGADHYAYYAMASAITAAVVIADVGLSMGVVRATARQLAATETEVREAERREIAAAHATYVGIGAISAILAIAVAAALPWLLPVNAADLSSARLTAFLVMAAAAVQLATSCLMGLPMGAQNYRITAVAMIAGAVLNLTTTIVGVPTLGVAALGLGSVASIVVNRAILFVWCRRNARWFRLRPSKPSRGDVSKVGRFAGPLVLLAAGGQIINATDLYVVGTVATATAVGFYRVGMMLPSQASSLLYKGYDTAYPNLAAAGATDSERALRVLTRLGSLAGGAGFGVLLWRAPDFVRLLVGSRNDLATEVFRLFALTWMLNVTVHGVGLTLISRGRQRAYAQLGVAEIVANLGLTFGMAHLWGPAGAAIATLVILGVFNTLVLPVWVHGEFAISIRRVVLVDGLATAVVGLAIAAAASLLASLTQGAILHVAITTVAAFLVAISLAPTFMGTDGRAALNIQGRRRLRPTPAEPQLGEVVRS